MTQPSDNNGYWIAFPPIDNDKLIANLQELSCTWVAPRITTLSLPELNLLSALKKANIKIFPWKYCLPFDSVHSQLIFKKLYEFGCDGYILDVEAEFNKQHIEAELLVQKVRDVIDDSWLAYAPFALPTWHQDFPYTTFGAICDAVMPQLYAYEFSDDGYKYWIPKYEEQWLKFDKNYPEIKNDRLPIGCSYRPKSRIMGGKSTILPKMDENIIATDISDYCEYFSGGLFTYEAMSQETYKVMVKARNPYA